MQRVLVKGLSLTIKGLLALTLIWIRATKELIFILKWKIIEMKAKDSKKKEIAKKVLKVAGKELITHFIIKGAISLGIPTSFVIMFKLLFDMLGW
jgi:hypothetical protein